jgi:HTH-type transcriptional regulator/antitoxin HigA
MVNKLVKTERDYAEALGRIEKLMDAKPGTPEADELELLAALVESYEESRFPVGMPDPVEAILFRLEQMGLSRQDLLPFFGSRSKVSEVLNRKKPLSLAMMRALHKGLGIPAEVLLSEPKSDFPADVPGLEWGRFPLKEMAQRGLIEDLKNARVRAEENIRRLIARAGGPKIAFPMLFRKRKSARENVKNEKYALWAWALEALISARRNKPKAPYGKSTMTAESLRDIAKLSYLKDGPFLAKEYLAKLGIAFAVVPHYPRTYLDGASFVLEDGTPAVVLTLRRDRIDNFWFALLHELAHIALGHVGPGEMIVDDLDLRGHRAEAEDRHEREADYLAEEALVPRRALAGVSSGRQISAAEVEALANALRVHPAVIAGRIRYESRNDRRFTKYVGAGEVRERFSEYRSPIKND